jgi:inositol phosphorylceramide mannosyltransferase catalytic subunit
MHTSRGASWFKSGYSRTIRACSRSSGQRTTCVLSFARNGIAVLLIFVFTTLVVDWGAFREAVLLASAPSPPVLPVTSGSTRAADFAVPRVVYQTWSSRLLPLGFQVIRERMRSRNPGFRFVVFDDADIDAYVSTHFHGTDAERAFRLLTVGAARADLWRYLVLFREGGVYLDLDSEIIVPIEGGLLKPGDGAIVSREGARDDQLERMMIQWLLAFEPGHAILARVIQRATSNILNASLAPGQTGVPPASILYLAGPPVFNRAVDDVARAALGEPPGWRIWESADDDVNPRLTAAGARFRIVGTDFREFAIAKHEYARHMYWFNPRWQGSELEWLPNALGITSLVALVAVVGSSAGRAALVASLRSRHILYWCAAALPIVFIWLVQRGFIQVL